jgi:hypothetical protein
MPLHLHQNNQFDQHYMVEISSAIGANALEIAIILITATCVGSTSLSQQSAACRFCAASDRLGRGRIMARKCIVSLAGAALVAITCLSAASTDAMAARRGVVAGGYRGGMYHGGVYRGGAYRGYAYRGGRYWRPGVGVGAAAVGAAAATRAYNYHNRPACGYYPYPPCQ